MNLSTPAHVPLQSPYPHLVLHAGEEVQHAAVREVPRVLTARLVEELLLQVHVIAPVSALQEDCLVEARSQAAGQEGYHNQQQGDTPADGLAGREGKPEDGCEQGMGAVQCVKGVPVSPFTYPSHPSSDLSISHLVIHPPITSIHPIPFHSFSHPCIHSSVQLALHSIHLSIHPVIRSLI